MYHIATLMYDLRLGLEMRGLGLEASGLGLEKCLVYISGFIFYKNFNDCFK